MPTLHRKLLGLLPRIGVRVLDLGSGAAVVYRRGERTRVPVGPRADLVLRGTAGASWKDVALGDSGARLLLDEKAAAVDERRFQVAAAAYLCGQHVAALLERCEVNCVFDVGANSGQYGRQLRRLGYRGRIVSFEPTAEAFGKLQKAAEGDPEWWVHRIGLGREDATQSINVGWNTMNSLLQPSDYGKDRYKRFAKSRTEDIEIRRLDGMMDKALAGITDPRPYLKMDTQGYDLEVFAGAGERVAAFVGMQSEVATLRLYEGSPRMAESIAVYEGSGFEITGMYPVSREPATGRVVEFDCVMVRADAVPRSG
ncbi:FkbM family methyltransferase [Streptomyces sp. NBC_01236]|uniref:FkbM family methyltransferase n=1 Tax=Streptomyces sp. NBC_01236 TaxID=2903789 RepID=UPI002E10F3F1|nr:FkbM family methyltransferase [Streptomyces sp. NBC_01236]